ncbi:MAG: dihydrolipoyl dehydrogenase [Gammaproteobacteria bacterium]|nr:MAG: dihydrolipoyl dehydrogenase [Gammaproteobacteria bacterium]
MTREVDVAILGAGSAGLFALSQVKRETDNYVLINGGELGTTCARVGCMPSKVLIQVAEDFHRKSIFGREGIDGAEALSVDVPASMEHVQDLRDVFVDQTLGVTDEMDETHLIDGYAKFIANDTVEVNGEQIRANSIIIATGSTPIVPGAWQEFADDVLTTDEFFELEDLPASMAVIGLGSIGLEIGQSLHRLGVRVAAVDQLMEIAKLEDDKVNELAITVISREFPLWLGEAAVLEKADGGVQVTAGENQVVVDKVLASLGRKPNLDNLSLEATDIKLDENGIPVFDPLTMQLEGLPIFIAGDVNADRPLLHEAGHEGRVAGHNAVRYAVNGTVERFKRKVPLGITFCDPNIATVGAQLSELDENDIAIGEIKFAPVGRALIIGKNRGLLRLYVQRSDGLLLGASMCCVKAENLAHLIAWSIQNGMTVFDMLKMPFYHPVIEEALQAALYSVLSQLDEKQDLVELERL